MVVTVAATGPGTDAEPVSSTFFASRYVRDPLPRSVPCVPVTVLVVAAAIPFQCYAAAARRPVVGPGRRD